MTIKAKFPSTCPKCGQSIQVGETIEWTKGSPARHVHCANGQIQESNFKPTDEQLVCMEAAAKTAESNGTVVIEAGAGTGKTSTLIYLANQMPKRKGKYWAFNKNIVEDVKAKCPTSLAAGTIHSSAFQAIGKDYAHRFKLRGSAKDMADRLMIDPWAYHDGEKAHVLQPGQVVNVANRTIGKFTQSADTELSLHHVPYINGVDAPGEYQNNRELARVVLPIARDIWADKINPEGRFRVNHGDYLKMWQLGDPKVYVDYIFFDEAQDASPVMSSIVENQDCQKILVGDSAQAINEWMGSINALQTFHKDEVCWLTQSFRFGQAIADYANNYLQWLDDIGENVTLRLQGNPNVQSELCQLDEPRAILTRTNAMAVRMFLEQQRLGRTAHLVGGGDEFLKFARAVAELQESGNTTHPDLMAFDSWDAVLRYVDEDELGSDLKTMVQLIQEITVPVIIEMLEKGADESNADVVVSTAHKCVLPNTLVETPDGIMKISDIPDSGVIATPSGGKSYVDKFTKKSGKVLTIKTKRGYEITVTPEHKLTTWNGSRHVGRIAQKLNKGDWLRLRLGHQFSQYTQSLPPSPGVYHNVKIHDLPAIMSLDLAEFIGLMVGDGTIFKTGTGIRLVKRHEDVVKRFGVLANRLFDCQCNPVNSHENATGVEIGSSQIAKWLSSIGGMNANDKGIPDCIMKSSIDMQAAFLRGLFEDGTVNIKHGHVDHIHFETAYEEMGRVVQILLLNQGIISSRKVSKQRKSARLLTHIYIYSDSIKKFIDKIGFISWFKNERLIDYTHDVDRRSLIPISRTELGGFEHLLSVTDKQNARLLGYMSRRVAYKVLKNTLLSPNARRLLVNRLKWVYEKIESIDESESETMCITVPDGGRFIQNGFDGWNSKGRQWDSVLLGPDFGLGSNVGKAELRLLYVASTRARFRLDAGGVVLR